ncbi:DNA-directed RNA polymerase I and III 14 KDA polypeptide [Venturia nashicola]|uniref:DNA-directed RNA polymerases I and III subunit RPAC2 n=1 Tax=Venturia nashicola TaxID=86259 RepID=A0A4Z1NU86_9PEZI|nr:DNA-directed RNA polymerase I and III 14 KDA polypeptide [Venturia nashicola]
MSDPKDIEMGDDAATNPSSENEALEEDELEKGLLPGGSETAASFEFTNEDHTLGNALRHIILKNPSVEFCGYSIPHPAETKMHLRIQTYDNVNVQDVLDKGLTDLMEMCDVVVEKFEDAQKAFKAKGPVAMEA